MSAAQTQTLLEIESAPNLFAPKLRGDHMAAVLEEEDAAGGDDLNEDVARLMVTA